jgi:hypothetical protein
MDIVTAPRGFEIMIRVTKVKEHDVIVPSDRGSAGFVSRWTTEVSQRQDRSSDRLYHLASAA